MNFRAQQWSFVRHRSGGAWKKKLEKKATRSRNVRPSSHPNSAGRRAESPKSPSPREDAPGIQRETTEETNSSPRIYFDPSNCSLDFSKPNNVLLDQILTNTKHRTHLRSQKPSQNWEFQQGKQLENLRRKTRSAISGARVSLQKCLTPLGLGDLVLLDFNSTELHLVAAEPRDLSSNTYTFVNSEGEILQGPKHMVKLRVPRVLSRDTVMALNLVSEETQHDGVARVGVLEQAGTGSSASQAPEPDYVIQAQTLLSNASKGQTVIVPESARQVYSRCLRKISIEAFQKVPGFTSKLDYMHNVLQYDQGNQPITSVQTLPIFELFEYVSGSKISQTQENMSRDHYRQANSDVRSSQTKQAGVSFTGISLPENTRENFASSSHSVSSYIAFMFGLQRSSHMWKINTQMSSRTPLSVDILPVRKSQMLNSTISLLKSPGTIEEFASAYVRYVQDKSEFPSKFVPVVQVLKDLIAENVVNHVSVESLTGKLVRAVDSRIGRNSPFAYSAEYSKSRAYDIVMAFSDVAEVNPASWSDSLALPGSGTSPDSDAMSRYFQYMDAMFPDKVGSNEGLDNRSSLKPIENLSNFDHELNNFYAEDPVAKSRKSFGQTPVYCIDSATAHEIDDGISIEEKEATYKITVHVANPTSYLRPESILSQIAFKKGATVYMPEGPSMMLPGLMSRFCGLNGTAKETRTIAIEYHLDKGSVDKHISAARLGNCGVSDDVAASIVADIKKSAAIRFYHVKNFPKGFTYEKVNEILEKHADDFRANSLPEGSHANNLYKLYHISSLLKHARVALGNGLLLNGAKSRVSVSHSQGLQETQFQKFQHGWQITAPRKGARTTPVISIMQEINQSDESKSQQLVSELMIGANFAGSQYALKSQIPFIHRTQELDLSLSAREEITRIMARVYAGRGDLTTEETAQILSVMTSANFESSPKSHESLGLEVYSNLTSPLRRYIDMVNHWNVQAHVQGRPDQYRKNGDLDYIANRLQIRESITKNVVRRSETFWTGKFLERYFAAVSDIPESDRIQFSVLLRSDSKNGDVRAELVGFGQIRLTIVSDEYTRSKFVSGQFRVGMVLHNVQFRVVTLDCIENDLTIQLMA